MNSSLASPNLSSNLDIALHLLTPQYHWGKITDTAHQFGVLRKKVYDSYQWAKYTLKKAFGAENSKKQRSMTLWQQDQERLLLSLRLRTNASIRGIQHVFQEALGVYQSHGKIWNSLHYASEKAKVFNKSVSYGNIKNIATDEIFLNGKPVLTGICLDTGTLLFLESSKDCKKETWIDLFERYQRDFQLSPDTIVKDAGIGMAVAAKEVFPDADHQADIFHIHYRFHPLRQRLENEAYSQIQKETDLRYQLQKMEKRLLKGEISIKKKQEKVAFWKKEILETSFESKKIRLKGSLKWKEADLEQEIREQNELQQKYRQAEKIFEERKMKTEKSIDMYDTFEDIYWKVEGYLGLTPEKKYRLWTAEEVQNGLVEMADALRTLGFKNLSTYLRNRSEEVSHYLHSLNERIKNLLETASSKIVSASIRVYQANLRVKKRGTSIQRKEWINEREDANLHLLSVFLSSPEKHKGIFSRVYEILESRYRASSAIENVHRILRPYLEKQCRVSEDFLELFQFYWNRRIRSFGKHKGSSALDMLRGCVSSEDWLCQLGYPHSRSFLLQNQL